MKSARLITLLLVAAAGLLALGVALIAAPAQAQPVQRVYTYFIEPGILYRSSWNGVVEYRIRGPMSASGEFEWGPWHRVPE